MMLNYVHNRPVRAEIKIPISCSLCRQHSLWCKMIVIKCFHLLKWKQCKELGIWQAWASWFCLLLNLSKYKCLPLQKRASHNFVTGLLGELNAAVYKKYLNISTRVYNQYSHPSTKNSTSFAWVFFIFSTRL